MVIRILLAINAISFILTSWFSIDLTTTFGMHYFLSGAFNPFQLITYMFVHGNFWHFAFNMLALFVFGVPLEKLWGAKRFSLYYFACGLGASIFYCIVYYTKTYDISAMIGASGAIFGILVAFAMMFPDEKINVYFILPIKAKHFVLIYGAIELISGLLNTAGGITAHYTHLGGMVTGFLFLKINYFLQARK